MVSSPPSTQKVICFPGGIIYASVLGQHILIINDREIAIELLEKRAHIYSDRPHIPMLELLENLRLSLIIPWLIGLLLLIGSIGRTSTL